MIGVQGQYVLQFSISTHKTLKDFISEDQLITFKLIEEAGNLLPIYELIFYNDNEEIFQLLHEGNDLDCTFGETENNAFTSKLTVTHSTCNKDGGDRRIIYLKGIYSAIPYITNSKMFISDYKSAIEVLKDKAVANFGSKSVISNITKSSDKQRWIQPSSSDKKFVNELWLHASIPGSFPAIGISSDGKFIIKDIVKDVKEGDKTLMWKFISAGVSDSKDIVYDGNAVIETNTGFINNWLGYGRELNALDLDTSFDFRILEEANPVIAMSSRMAKRIEVDKRFASVGIQNENTHENYWQAYMHNLTHLASFQNIKVTFTFQSMFKPVRILDKVNFSDKNTSGVGSSEFSSGVYYITKIARNITHRQFSTTVVLSRESINAVKTSN